MIESYFFIALIIGVIDDLKILWRRGPWGSPLRKVFSLLIYMDN